MVEPLGTGWNRLCLLTAEPRRQHLAMHTWERDFGVVVSSLVCFWRILVLTAVERDPQRLHLSFQMPGGPGKLQGFLSWTRVCEYGGFIVQFVVEKLVKPFNRYLALLVYSFPLRKHISLCLSITLSFDGLVVMTAHPRVLVDKAFSLLPQWHKAVLEDLPKQGLEIVILLT